MPPSNAPQVAATRASGLPADGPGYPSRPTTTSTDGVGYALCALAFEVVLSRRVNDEHRPSPFELIVLALGVALGLAALGWWCSPGTHCAEHRSWAAFALRLHHLVAVLAVPSSVILRQHHSHAWLDFAFVMVPPGWIGVSVLMQLNTRIPLRPALVLDILTVLSIRHKSIIVSALPFVAPLEEHFAAALRLLLRPSLARPLRGRLSRRSAQQQCQVVIMVVRSLVGVAFPKVVELELWTRQQKQQQQQRQLGLNENIGGAGSGDLPPPTSPLPRTWLSLSGPLRLVVYVLGLQLLIPALLLVASLVTAA